MEKFKSTNYNFENLTSLKSKVFLVSYYYIFLTNSILDLYRSTEVPKYKNYKDCLTVIQLRNINVCKKIYKIYNPRAI